MADLHFGMQCVNCTMSAAIIIGGGGTCSSCGGLLRSTGGPAVVLNYCRGATPSRVGGTILARGIGSVTGIEAGSTVVVESGTSIEVSGIGSLFGVVVQPPKKSY
jgi:hypothetical protein